MGKKIQKNVANFFFNFHSGRCNLDGVNWCSANLRIVGLLLALLFGPRSVIVAALALALPPAPAYSWAIVTRWVTFLLSIRLIWHSFPWYCYCAQCLVCSCQLGSNKVYLFQLTSVSGPLNCCLCFKCSM